MPFKKSIYNNIQMKMIDPSGKTAGSDSFKNTHGMPVTKINFKKVSFYKVLIFIDTPF